MEGEAQQQHPPFPINTTTNPHLTPNYPLNSLLSPPPPAQHHNLPPLDQEPLPLDIDWASLLSSCEVDPTASASSSTAVEIGGDVGQVRVGGRNRGYKGRACEGKRKKAVGAPQRVAFHTRSVEDVLDDGYKWRKYGQKAVKNSSHPR